MMSLSNQVNEIYSEQIQLKKILGLFVSKLNEKIESVDNFHILNTEIEQGVYNSNLNLVSICNILSQLDNRSIKDERKLNIIRRSMENQKILSDTEKMLGDHLIEVTEISLDDVGIVYSEINSIRHNFIANLIAEIIEAYHFLPDTLRRMKSKKAIVETVLNQEQFDFEASLSTNLIWQELINSKLNMVNSLLSIPKDQFSSEIVEAENLYLQCKFDEAFAIFEMLADEGNERAYYFMVEYYANGYGSISLDKNEEKKWRIKCENSTDTLSRVQAIYLKSVKTGEFANYVSQIIGELFNLANEGDPFASFEIYSLVESGYYEMNYDSAKEYAKMAYERGHFDIMYKVGKHFENLEEDEKANEYYKIGSKMGSPWAQCNLAHNYEIGRGIDQDNEMAFELYKASAEKGCAYAQEKLGDFYFEGRYFNQDFEEAFKWYSIAANKNYASAQNKLGVRYECGQGVEQNFKEAIKWYKKAADQKDSWAQNNLADCYYRGIVVEKDYQKAVNLYRQAAEQGNSIAMNNLASCYHFGNGVEKSYLEAAKWYKKAADFGNADAQNNLGDYYHAGNGVTKNDSLAFQYYKIAANNGNENAKSNVAKYYYYGICTAKDYNKAVDYLRSPAERGITEAQALLGECYIYGRGVEKNYQKAVEWLQKAVEENNFQAKYLIGKCYYDGLNVKIDTYDIVKWLTTAAINGKILSC